MEEPEERNGELLEKGNEEDHRANFQINTNQGEDQENALCWSGVSKGMLETGCANSAPYLGRNIKFIRQSAITLRSTPTEAYQRDSQYKKTHAPMGGEIG
ncbi:hypothetical protein DUI87_10870 [Hirundo rustica rustica]|uniref:Uncharacterized protein n=1 Tax=Hirundo rustica rustica TaxID=333673 RepID=A0A3M0KJW3_HIRRU|nr:hypothetical protein DUI87_10870 [Hirundo rustica rustica]